MIGKSLTSPHLKFWNMPSGRTHDIITAATTPIVGVVTWQIADLKTGLILMFAYLFASLMFNGDLDTESRPIKRWWIFKWIWYPYKEMIPHRSIWSHGVIVGTLVRILYLAPLGVLIWGFFGFQPFDVNWYRVLLVLIGLELGNTVHTVSDKIGSLWT